MSSCNTKSLIRTGTKHDEPTRTSAKIKGVSCSCGQLCKNFRGLKLHQINNISNNITTKLYNKRDTFGFHVVNFPFMSSNIPSAPAYGVYASQLILCARCCSNYSDFLLCHRALVTRLLSQGYKANCLSNTFMKFYGRHMDLVGQYKKNVCQMFADSIS